MNRRRFSCAMLGAGSLLVSGLAIAPSAFARTSTDDDDDQDSGRSSDTTEDELLEHVVDSWQRSYECEDPVTFVTALAVEFDKKRNAQDAFAFMRDGALEGFDGFVVDDEGDYGDLTDDGYLYYGVSGTGSSEMNVALLYAQQGKLVYAIVAAGIEDQVDVAGAYYETLFDEDREETEALLTEDEMPRGFVLSEDSDDTGNSGDDRDADEDDDTSDRDRDRDDSGDEDEDADRGTRKGSAGRAASPSRLTLGSAARHLIS
ncbi:MAG: hypothetical protein ACTHQE_12315 [Thermomicrobiales bacterium]